MKRFLFAATTYLPPIAVYALIFWLSSRPASDLKFAPPDFLSHFFEYFVLAFLAARAAGRPPAGKYFRGFVMGLLFLAALDEFHQYWVPTRIWSALDLVYDAAGILAGIAAYRWWISLKIKTDADQERESAQVE